ncbi:RHS repeat-associated core domain-containing protein [Cystobacter fuscus]|uniref:NHL domain-containing protein n=1 Tax=Cystobacter fuscus TaxID=43 RepID=UPI0037BF457F
MEVLPGQGFEVTVRLSNESAASAEQVRVREIFQGTQLPPADEVVGPLAAGEERVVTFRLAAPVVAARGEGESAATYLQRLEELERQHLLSQGEVHFADAQGAEEQPLSLFSASRLLLPRLTLSLEGPSRVLPGQDVTYTLTASNVGSALAASANVKVVLPDATQVEVPLEAMAPGGARRKEVTWMVPPLPMRQPGESALEYAARLRALNGQEHQTQMTLSWRDGQGNTYGSVDEVTTAALLVEVPPSHTPPNPEEVAPPLPTLSVPTFVDSVSFLYSGDNPIQEGVVPGSLKPQRLAVLRGKVMSREGHPLSQVRVSVLDHPEYGHTLTRENGLFDFAVNGGGPLTVRYEAEGLLSAQRLIQVPWGDFAWMPDVVLVALDSQGTPVDFSGASTTIQVARGSAITDADGSRQATLLFTPGTHALAVLPNGDEVPLFSATVRATEYTVGEAGPDSMPAHLPSTSGYTYAVELSLDEAMALDSQEVRFTQPVVSYVDNFLSFPVGGAVPAGYYDRKRGRWLPSGNGRIIQVLGVLDGAAQLDVTGDGLPDGEAVLVELGISDAEQRQLASLYPEGKTLWRVLVSHFTPWDYNWPYGPPLGARGPKNAAPQNGPEGRPDCQRGSIIDCQNQALGESLPLAGTPFRLHYRSDRMLGADKNTLRIPVSGASVPSSLQRFVVEVGVAGRRFTYSLPAIPNQTLFFTWDGKDAYGRAVQGEVPVTGRTGYLYPLVYLKPAEFAQAFALAGDEPIYSRQQREMTLWQTWGSKIGGWSESPENLGGWQLSPQHQLMVRSNTILLGNGNTEGVQWNEHRGVISTVAGRNGWGYGGDGGPATQALFSAMRAVAAGPDGSLYIADAGNHRIRRVGPDGIVSTVAGNGDDGVGGDGGPATQAQLHAPVDIAVGPDGSIYIVDIDNNIVRRVGPDGIISTVAGTGEWAHGGDGGPATQAHLDGPAAVAVGADGSFYISDYGSHIRRVGLDGIITTVVGTGMHGSGGDGGPATQADISLALGLVVGGDGSLYFADVDNNRVRRVGPDGIISTVAGNGQSGAGGEGGPATQARLSSPLDVAVGGDGSLYVVCFFDYRVLRVGPDGIISVVAGTGVSGSVGHGDGGPATQARFYHGPSAIAMGPDDSLHAVDGNQVRSVRFSPWVISSGERSVASKDGRDVYVFANGGRHLRTVDSLTGALRYGFEYDAAGRLSSIVDGDGLLTRVERDALGKPLAIVAPHGQRTRLALDDRGYLAALTNLAGERVELNHDPNGLLSSMRDARGGLHQYTYDTHGKLARDTLPAGGYKQLTRTDAEDGYTVMLSTALGRTTRYQVHRLPGGGQKRTTTAPDGTVTLRLMAEDGSSTTTTAPDGTVTTEVLGPDARFGMQAPLVSSKVTLPSGLTSTVTRANTVTYVNGDPLQGISAVVDTRIQNGRTEISTYAPASRTLSTKSPEGRLATSILDEKGRLIRQEVSGVLPLEYSYDAEGRPWKVSQGERTEAYAYNSLGFLASVEDVLDRTTGFSYNLVGRFTAQHLPGGRTVEFSSDAHGNLIQLVPPERPAHAFRYSLSDTMKSYTPPPALASTSSVPTQYAYNLDGAFTSANLPDGSSVQVLRDSAGRVDVLTTPRTSVDFGYDAQGRLAALTDSTGPSLAIAYDGSLVKRVAWSGGVQGSVGYSYTPDFTLSAVEVQGQSIAYGYDNDGLLISAGALSLRRRPDNGLLSGTILDQVNTEQQYTPYGEVHTLSAVFRNTMLYSLSLDRDVAGRIISKTEVANGVTHEWGYSYDTVGRLHTVTLDGEPYASYGYDANSNRTSLSRRGVLLTATYDAQDRLQTFGSSTYTFGVNGALQQRLRPPEAAPTQYAYDALGALTHVQLPNGTQLDYVVDASNRRVGKRLNGTLIQAFLYDGPLRVVAELDGSGAVVSRFVYASQRHVPDYMVKGGITYRLLTDHLGSIRLVVNASTGVVAQALEYGPFGEVLSDSNPGFQPFAFAGGLYDAHSGLVRFGARDYDAETGVWTSRDPLLFAGGQLNLYQYAAGNPVNLLDPTGLASVGYSSYAGMGFGFEFAWWPGEGYSVCYQMGVGGGGGFSVNPYGTLAASGVSLNTEISGSALGFKAKIGSKRPFCGDWEDKGSLGFKQGSMSFPDGGYSFGAGTSSDLGVKVQATVSAQVCVRF